MSTQAPWLALSVDWQDSDMFADATAEERLAWICLLCHAKTHGRGGVVRAKPDVLVKRWGITKLSVLGMFERARVNGAVTIDTDWTVTIVNWKTYQDPRHRGTKPQTGVPQGLTDESGHSRGFTETAVKDATPYPLPLTTDHRPKTSISPPTPPGGESETEICPSEDENRNQPENLFPPESPPPKSRVKPQRNNKQAEADALKLYEAYPIHKDRGHALKAIRKALKAIPVEVLLPKVVAFAESEEVQARLGTPDEQFIKRAATWFNGECWADEAGEQSRAARLLGLEDD